MLWHTAVLGQHLTPNVPVGSMAQATDASYVHHEHEPAIVKERNKVVLCILSLES